MKLVQISPSIVDGKIVGYYFLYTIPVQRGMCHQKVDELLIHGIPIRGLDKYVRKHIKEILEYQKGE